MKYCVVLPKSVQKALDRLPDEVVKRVLAKLAQLETDPRPADVKKLKGREAWRIRVGVILLVLGTGPLASTMVVARLGFTDDPNPNPVLFGMLAGLTFWPSVALIAFGAWRIRKALRAT